MGVDGVQVLAPARWRAGNVRGTSMTVERLPSTALPVPLAPEVRLALPVYAVRVTQDVLAADRGRFLVRLPLGKLDPSQVAPLILLAVTVDAKHPVMPDRQWVSAPRAKVKGGFLEFEVTGFLVDEALLFAAEHLAD
ncbi:hypothetical protein GCM10008955_32820 [Deinococcus malanensis]|uniref:PilZ domain-containing protein n=1 Tax=Deinococcus malanensis TaxID=1706855 RepID=A0ABQ2EZP2_9DEIO|nr:hypothetical protein GCM10008955_32820 [Deinococcus malanensis]